MWQQVGNSNRKDLFVWVAETAGIGNHDNGFGSPPENIYQGGPAMGFYNMNTGDAPFFKQMADNYATSDYYHQFVMGGTGANFIGLVTGDTAFFNKDGQGGADIKPPGEVWQGVTNQPDREPQSQTGLSNPNRYTGDDYRGDSYVNCADTKQPGVQPVVTYLGSLRVKPNCTDDTYYLVNNYNLA